MLVKNWGEIRDQFFKKLQNLIHLFIKSKFNKVSVSLVYNAFNTLNKIRYAAFVTQIS